MEALPHLSRASLWGPICRLTAVGFARSGVLGARGDHAGDHTWQEPPVQVSPSSLCLRSSKAAGFVRKVFSPVTGGVGRRSCKSN